VTSKDDSRQAAKGLYDLEMGLWEMGWSTLSYDEENDCFRFAGRRFAFSKSLFGKVHTCLASRFSIRRIMATLMNVSLLCTIRS
jgi:hypothetical protein